MRAFRVLPILPIVLLLALGVAPAAAATTSVDVVASGLDSPRHLAFGSRGDLFVAESGRGGSGPCFVGGEGPACMGATGAVTKIDRWGRQSRIAEGLASYANTPDNTNAIGPHGITVLGADRVFVTNGGPTEPKDASGSPISRDTLAGQNPVAVLFDRGRFVVADAGGNAIDVVNPGGGVSNLAVFANRLVPNPFGGPEIPMQAVPTSVVVGPDRQYYVSQLTGFPFPPGGANVYRVDPRTGAVTVFASGFTNIMDLAFGRNGTLYVLEIDHDGLLGGSADGGLFAVSPDGTKRQIALAPGTLTMPGGIAVGRDGLYVTNNAGSPGGGQVLRIRTS